ncbi:MAG: hypothetical protein PHF57_03330 [Methanoregula sp.]|nr:hypothetical protein [Methanoregula sp.]
MSLSAILSKLKHLAKIEGCTFNFINIQINSNNTSEKYFSLNGGQTLGINLNKLTPPEKDVLKTLIPQMIEDRAILLEDTSKERIEDIESKEKTPDEREILAFFKDKIPHGDYTALRASLYLRKRFLERASKDEIAKLKSEIIYKYGKRGRNISDLCSAMYFETLIKTIFEEKERSGYTEKEILETYDLIVEEGTLTVFVSSEMSSDQVRREIEGKIKRNKQYGLHILYIHGIGRTNIETIRMVIYDLKEKYPSVKKITEEYANIISVKLEF